MSTASHPVDVLALCAPGDAERTSRWVRWLRELGITVQASITDTVEPACAPVCAIAFTSGATEAEVTQNPAIGAALLERKPVIIVRLEASSTEQPAHVFTIINAWRMKPEAARDALKRALDRHDIRGIRHDFIWHGQNERRRGARIALRLQWVLVSVVLLLPLLAWFLWPERERQLAVPAALPPVATDRAGPAPSLKAARSSDADQNVPVAVPVQPPPAEKSRVEVAMEHVRAHIAATCRENGFTSAQIDQLASCFADPVFIESKGKQPVSGVRASLKLYATQWPWYQEKIEEISAEEQQDGTVAVRVRSSYESRNDQEQTKDAGAWRPLYTVSFSAEGKPLISRIEFPSVRM